MFQNCLLTSLTTPLCNTNEISCWDNRPFSAVWPETQQNQNKASDLTTIKKRKKKRTRTAFTTNQLSALEDVFASSKYVSAVKRKELADYLNIPDKAIKIWFQNRRMKEKTLSASNDDIIVDSSSNEASPPIKENPEDNKVEPTNSVHSGQFQSNIAEPQYPLGLIPYGAYTPFQGGPSNVPQNVSWHNANVYPMQYPYADYSPYYYPSQQGPHEQYNLHEFQ